MKGILGRRSDITSRSVRRRTVLRPNLRLQRLKRSLRERPRRFKSQDHHIVIAFGAKPPDEGDTDTTCEGLVDLGLILELRMQQ